MRRIACNKCGNIIPENVEKCPICYPMPLDFDYLKYKAGELKLIILPRKQEDKKNGDL